MQHGDHGNVDAGEHAEQVLSIVAPEYAELVLDDQNVIPVESLDGAHRALRTTADEFHVRITRRVLSRGVDHTHEAAALPGRGIFQLA